MGFVAILAMGNLRGVREAGKIFRVPTYFFIAMMGILILLSFVKLLGGNLPAHASQFPLPPTRSLGGLLLIYLTLKAFASGGAAVTGVEAISNGVPAFKPPEWRNAITTLMWMGTLLGGMFFGLSVLAAHMHVVPDPQEKVTVLAQVGKAAFGTTLSGNALFVMLQVATMLILVLAANTSYADFPRLASFHAGDSFLPRQLTRYGDRLVFSNGIVVLSGFAVLLIVLFKASVTRLIPLYAIGVFTSFTFSQLGMAKRHLTRREPRWRTGLFFNGFGGVVSGIMTVIIAATKFSQGAWIILITIPTMLFGLLRVNKHYREAKASLRNPGRKGPVKDLPRQTIVIPVGEPGPNDTYAAAYAERVFPREVRLVHFAPPGTRPEDALEKWAHLGQPIDLIMRRRNIPTEIRDYVRRLRGELGGETLVNVIIPETVREQRLRYLLHTLHIQRIKYTLSVEDDLVVTNVAHHPGYDALEPVVHPEDVRRVMEGWHHVAIVLVSGLHNATGRSLRYAKSLRADELRALHVQVETHETEEIVAAWHDDELGAHLEVLPSPYRQIAKPIHSYVRRILEEQPRTFVTIVIPELVVRKRWHRLLHNQTALTLKRTFLFEPSVVVSAVPYRL